MGKPRGMDTKKGRGPSDFRLVALASSRHTWTPACCVREARLSRGGSVCLFHVSSLTVGSPAIAPWSTNFREAVTYTESMVGMKYESVAAIRGGGEHSSLMRLESSEKIGPGGPTHNSSKPRYIKQ